MINLARENQSVRTAHSGCYSTLLVDSARVIQLIINDFNRRQKICVFSRVRQCHLECRLDYQRYGELAAG